MLSATTATTTTTISTLISLRAAADGALPGALFVHRNRSGKLFPHDRAGVQLGVWSSAPACGGITLRGAFNCRSTPNSAVAVAHRYASVRDEAGLATPLQTSKHARNSGNQNPRNAGEGCSFASVG